MPAILFTIIGYLSGGVLYAQIFTRLFHKTDAIAQSKDQNPGATNAFMYGGFWCGLLTLLCDFAKGFLPVFVYVQFGSAAYPGSLLLSLVLAAPVIGHVFPLFYQHKGGKGITVTFGVLCGLMPYWKPLAILVVLFIFFSLVLRITPHFYRTYAAYICTLTGMMLWIDEAAIRLGFLLITAGVLTRLHLSTEKREKPGVKLLWMH